MISMREFLFEDAENPRTLWVLILLSIEWFAIGWLTFLIVAALLIHKVVTP